MAAMRGHAGLCKTAQRGGCCGDDITIQYGATAQQHRLVLQPRTFRIVEQLPITDLGHQGAKRRARSRGRACDHQVATQLVGVASDHDLCQHLAIQRGVITGGAAESYDFAVRQSVFTRALHRVHDFGGRGVDHVQRYLGVGDPSHFISLSESNRGLE